MLRARRHRRRQTLVANAAGARTPRSSSRPESSSETRSAIRALATQCPLPPDADRRRTAPSYYILTNLGQRDEPPGGPWGFLIFINLFIFFLAFFLDFFEIAFIILPMIAATAQKMLTPIVGSHAALIWFGVMLCVNMQTSFMHPPFGFALFYLRGVAPKEVKTSDIYWGALPWVGLQLIM